MTTDANHSSVQALNLLVGDRVISVTFIHDYMQLHFEHAYLNITNPSTVVTNGVCSKFESAEYANYVRKLIGECVRSVSAQAGSEINIEFANESRFAISLRPEDYEAGPEAVMIQHDSGVWNVW